MSAVAELVEEVVEVRPRLQVRGLRKAFGDVVANDDVALTIAPAEIHAVLGENGAGKSTLMKLIYGAYQPDEGDIRVDGAPVKRGPPRPAKDAGAAPGTASALPPPKPIGTVKDGFTKLK